MQLRIYAVILSALRALGVIAARIARHDCDLARQLRRAAASVALNTSEGAYSQGRNARARFYSAMASANEVVACLDTAEAFGYVAEIDPALRRQLDQIIGTLCKLSRR